MNTFKSFKIFFVGSDATQDIAYIKLHHFISGTFSSIGYFTTHLHFLVGSNNFGRNTDIRIFKCSITQPMPKWIKGTIHTRHITFRTGILTTVNLRRRFAGKVKGDLAYTFRKSDCKLPTRIIVTKQYVGYCRSSFRSRIPGFYNSRYKFICPVYRERTSVDKYQYNWFACSLYCFQQVKLTSRKIKTAAGFIFSAGPLSTTQYHYCYICLFGLCHCFVYFVLFIVCQRIVNDFRLRPVGIYQFTTFGVEHLGFSVYFLTDTTEHGSHIHC